MKFGAGGENRTPISSLENLHTSRCTTPANVCIVPFSCSIINSMGMRLSRFFGNDNQDDVFHSSGLADESARQIGGVASPSKSFSQRQAARRQRRFVGDYNSARVVRDYRIAAEENQRASEASSVEASPGDNSPASRQAEERSLKYARLADTNRFGSSGSNRGSGRGFSEPPSRRRDSYTR